MFEAAKGHSQAVPSPESTSVSLPEADRHGILQPWGGVSDAKRYVTCSCAGQSAAVPCEMTMSTQRSLLSVCFSLVFLGFGMSNRCQEAIFCVSSRTRGGMLVASGAVFGQSIEVLLVLCFFTMLCVIPYALRPSKRPSLVHFFGLNATEISSQRHFSGPHRGVFARAGPSLTQLRAYRGLRHLCTASLRQIGEVGGPGCLCFLVQNRYVLGCRPAISISV